jgi:hypothetical protein
MLLDNKIFATLLVVLLMSNTLLCSNQPEKMTAEEAEKIKRLISGIYCFTTIQKYFNDNSELLSEFKIIENGQHKFSKLIANMFKDCKISNKDGDFHSLYNDMTGEEQHLLVSSLFEHIDIGSFIKSNDFEMTPEEQLYYKDFLELEEELKQRKPKKQEEPQTDQVKEQQTNWLPLTCLLVVLLVGAGVVWKTLVKKKKQH